MIEKRPVFGRHHPRFCDFRTKFDLDSRLLMEPTR